MKNEVLRSLKKSPQNTKPTNWKPNWNPRTKKKKSDCTTSIKIIYLALHPEASKQNVQGEI